MQLLKSWSAQSIIDWSFLARIKLPLHPRGVIFSIQVSQRFLPSHDNQIGRVFTPSHLPDQLAIATLTMR
jgi:hypothetical protein